MVWRKRMKEQRAGERGATLVIFAFALVFLLGMSALAVDLASMYVARSESQRAADAAALAGAKYFVESGCVTIGNCAGFETVATARATEVAAQSFVEGRPATINGAPTFNMAQAQNPQITVQVQSASLRLFFARAFYGLLGGAATPITVGASASAEAWNPSGATGGPIYCTGCVRPWLIPNCDQGNAGPTANALCAGGTPAVQAYLLDPGSNYGVENPGCYPGGVVGSPIAMRFQLQPTLFGGVDVTNGTGNTAPYQQAIPICSIGQQTCGNSIPFYILPVNAGLAASTQAGVESLTHVTALGLGVGQDYILPGNTCPPQIQAGAQNPLVTSGVVAQDNVISTSDSIVTAYIYDNAPIIPQLVAGTSQSMKIVGFAQIFVTQVDIDALGNTEVQGIILAVAGCGSNLGACGVGAGNGRSINGPTTIPVRLIAPSN